MEFDTKKAIKKIVEKFERETLKSWFREFRSLGQNDERIKLSIAGRLEQLHNDLEEHDRKHPPEMIQNAFQFK